MADSAETFSMQIRSVFFLDQALNVKQRKKERNPTKTVYSFIKFLIFNLQSFYMVLYRINNSLHPETSPHAFALQIDIRSLFVGKINGGKTGLNTNQ